MKKLLISCAIVFCSIGCDSDNSENGISETTNDYSNLNLSNTNSEQPVYEKYTDYGENNFINTDEEPISTFSIDADGASYANTRRFLRLGQNPPPESVRVEEYLNYFTFDYEEPRSDENVALNAELSTCPWNAEHHMMRLGMKGKTFAEEAIPDANYVFLIDVSGSMSDPEKLELLKSGFKLMVDRMRDTDRMAIVTYSGSAGVLLESTFGDEKQKIKDAIDQLGAGGSTAGAQGILTAYEIAEKNFVTGGNNRIILGSDGDFNVGPSSIEELVKLVEEKRENGVYLTVLGVGSGNLNDALMEQIANKGNGNYEYIDTIEQLKKVFINERGKFYAVAKDSKIQVTFDASTVASYRLIGYENRALENDDFEDDSVDAGEIGSGQTITALYELILTNAAGQTPAAKFDFRYKKPDSGASSALTIAVAGPPANMAAASDNMRFSAAVAGFGLLMKDSEFKGDLSLKMIRDLSKNALGNDPFGYKQEFVNLIPED